ncbi:MAG: chemotaxis protein CheB [Desulfobaccales bacterium]
MAATKSGASRKAISKAGSRGGKVNGPKKPPAKRTGEKGAGAAPNPPGLETAPESPAPARPFAIVGIGASAGGLEAFTRLIGDLPTNTGMGFVLVQHMAPRAHSMLPEILAKTTRMPVTEVQDGTRVQPNIIYVTPPDILMTLEKGVLHLASRAEPRVLTRPIDIFLRSLAQDEGSRAIGVILSGTASDGVLGLQAIKAEGGVTFAQDLETAKYPGMPESAIAAGVVDFVLTPEKIARKLASLAQHHPLPVAPHPAEEAEVPLEEGVFNQILMLLKTGAGLDFTYYKHNTIKRRLHRRMLLQHLETIEDYAGYLRQHPEEVKNLCDDILINVTSFFREPESFGTLQKIVFPEILRNRAEDEPIRIWVPGCATGEEAYSLAISLLEFLGDMASNVQIQIFATDVEDGMIGKARLGIYPEAITAEVSANRLRRFFSKVAGGYQVSKTIRSMCVFAKQNLTKDPPFSRIDLISCRNVLIYFGAVLQKKVIPIFHFALKPNGFLLLGKSEALTAFSEYFNPLDKKLKVFQKKKATVPFPALPPFPGPGGGGAQGLVEGKPSGELLPLADLQQETDRIVLSRFAPAGVVIDAHLNIIQFRGHTGRFLEPSPGEASLNLLKMVRQSMAVELRAAVFSSLKSNTPVRREGLRLRLDGALRVVNLEVCPLRPATALDRYFLVVFEDATAPVKEVPKGKEPRGKSAAKGRTLNELESELAATKEYLQTVIEEQETSVEELQSSNEELMSANEELQSINEEMETSKEELQSANEELETLNEELGNRNQELFQANNDLSNLLTVVQVAIVILGPDLRIRRFNPAAQEMLGLIPGDVGRPLGDIRLKVEVANLEAVFKEVLSTLSVQELEVQDRNGRWVSLRLRPYRTSDNKIDGVVLAVVEVDLIKRSLEEARQARDYARAIVATVREALVVLDGKLRVVSANDAYYRVFKVKPEDTEGHYFSELGGGQWNIHRLRQLLSKVLPSDQHFQDFEMVQKFPEVGRRTFLLNGRLLSLGGPARDRILLAIEDITERREAEEVLRESEAKLRNLAMRLLAYQEEERREISSELQESLAQGIAAVKLRLRTIAERLPGSDEAVQQDYRQALGDLDQIVEKLRRRAAALSPQMLADLGLAGGLKVLADSCDVECDLHMNDLGRVFTMEDQVSIYRIFQEALSNVCQHAQATRVTLAGKKVDGQVEFLVEDNGQGFEVGRPEDLEGGRRGIGLASMAERVKALGGTFKLESQVGVGTRVFFTIPQSKKK